MCGIAGIVNFGGCENSQALLRRMLGIIRHRGPDAFGIYQNDCAALASTRLSIIDLNTGDQPIHNEDGSVWVVLNGEIFNYPELRELAKSRGHSFHTSTDTEVLVHLYEDEGHHLLDRLNGQFAFAIWDVRKRMLLLGRDRMGIRPLFYYLDKDHLVFASEIKALFVDPDVPRQMNSKALGDIFTCWAPLGSETPFARIFQIPPGHYAFYSKDGMKCSPYWNLDFHETGPWERPVSDWMKDLSELLLDATRIRLRADVPVGAYLSGGLDSSLIATMVKRSFNNELCTFSIGFSDDRFDEAAFQKSAVNWIGTRHKGIQCSEADIGAVFRDVIWHTETPLLRTGPAPLFMLSRLVRDQNFKVVLTGEGADELFAGYNIFKEDKVRRFWARRPESVLRPRLLERLYPYVFSQGNGKGKVFLTQFFKKDLQEVDSPVYSHLLRWGNTAQLKSFFRYELQQEMGRLGDFIVRFVASLPKEFAEWSSISRAQYTEVSIFLTNYLLSSQGDRMTMAHSVEGRFPYLDHRVVEFASRLPSHYRMNGLKEKFLLKQIARNFIPPELIERPKQPYRAPISKCFLGPAAPDYAEDLLSENAIRRKGYFDLKKVLRLLEKCRGQAGYLLSERENMAVVGILSTQLLDELFLQNFPPFPIKEPEDVKVYRQEAGKLEG